ncbi:neuropeptide prohormone-4-like [Argonauta hians]
MRTPVRLESYLLVAWILCLTTCAMTINREQLKRMFSKRNPTCQGNPCPPYKPFLCKTSHKCLALSSVCDDIPNCEDGFDEDPALCMASKRPRVEEMYDYLSGPGAWTIEKLFDGIDADVVAVALATAMDLSDLQTILGLSNGSMENIEKALIAAEEDDPREMNALGMPERNWPMTSQLLRNLLDTGFGS